MPSYVANPFAGAAPGAKSAAYAGALRNYAPNQFAGTQSPQGAMAPHLSQAPPLSPDLIEAYQWLKTNPQAQQYSQSGVDINKLWRQSPQAPIFKPGFQHNPYVMQRSRQMEIDRNLAALPPEEIAQMNINPSYRGE